MITPVPRVLGVSPTKRFVYLALRDNRVVLAEAARRMPASDPAAGHSALVGFVGQFANALANGIRQTARWIDHGGSLAEVIGVAVTANAPARDVVLVEGHTRAAAYVLANKPPAEGSLLIGWSSSMPRWRFF